MSELKPCPFCDGTDVHLIPTGIGAPPRWCVICYGCRTEGPVDLGESGAVEQWNTRPVEDTLRAELERVLKTMADATAALEKWTDQWKWWDNPEDDAMMAEIAAMSTDELVAAIEASAGSRPDVMDDGECAEPTPPAEEAHT